MQFELIKSIIEKSIDELYEYDNYLLQEDVHEQSICSMFAEYIRKNLKDQNAKWDVDNEYNRCESFPKRLNRIGNVKPDIIIHKRGLNNIENIEYNNLLVIEMKKNPTVQETINDLQKIDAFIEESPFHYCYGLFIGIRKDCYPDLIWKKRG
jgi:hypothetical protein